ncbi:MAG: thiamine-phosphate kinase [Acidobacteriota bacterium]
MKTEFEFINNIKERFAATRIGDDCAVLPKDDQTDQLITADLLVEDIDFRLEWTTPQFLGHKALAVSLSDIAAMGGTPRWAMLTIGVPEHIWNSGFLDDFYEGWGRLAAQFQVELIGGDVSRTPDKIVIDSIVGGEVPKGKAILRSGARPGDRIYVTGQLGGAAAGLKLLESGVRMVDSTEIQKALIERQLRPFPQIEIGRTLMGANLATSMIDLSDGLSSDLAHICEASGVGAAIDASLLPIDSNPSKLSITREDTLDLALNGGEDFELLFTADPKSVPELMHAIIHRIGTVTANAGILELIRDGKHFELTPGGYRHF